MPGRMRADRPFDADRMAVETHRGRGGPILLSVPHSGREYPPDLVAAARSGRRSLELLEDPLVDLLVAGLVERGFPAAIARAPRALIDVNRAEDELDPRAILGRSGEAPTARARAGLGIIPTRLSGHGALWRAPIAEHDYNERLTRVHRPYHQALADALEAMRKVHGEVVLIDCHSMPARRSGEPAIVIGDRHGTSAAPWLFQTAAAAARGLGFAVAHNDPFAGGHICERHGRPARGTHAIQIEVDRSAYLQRDGRTPSAGFERVALLFAAIVEGCNAGLAERRQAAE